MSFVTKNDDEYENDFEEAFIIEQFFDVQSSANSSHQDNKRKTL